MDGLFDSIPHNWVEKSVQLTGLKNKIIKFCMLSVEKWNTKLKLKTTQELAL
jgi:hypothetical protein